MRGRSAADDPRVAVDEAARGFDQEPDVLFVFHSTAQDAEGVHAALLERFPDVPLAGCTTAGEQLDGGHSNGGLVMMGVADSGLAWAVRPVRGLGDGCDARIDAAVGELFGSLDIDPDESAEGEAVCLLFIDGLSGAEEHFAAHLADALQGIPMAGGSAGDDLSFTETRVLCSDGAYSDAAVLVCAKSLDGTPIRMLKHQHFVATPRSLVVTRAQGRTVFEFDGLPALEAYAEAVGLAPEDVDGDVTFMNPVTFACNGELYVRSVQSIGDDGSMAFYCAVEEGMVLDVGGHEDMTERLRADIAGGFGDPPGFVVGFNCILRALEATGRGLHEDIGCVVEEAGFPLIGFDTYGEQLNGLHINQTLVAVGFGLQAA